MVELAWREILSDYVTAIAWAANGHTLAASSAAGEVLLWNLDRGWTSTLRSADGLSINGLAFSRDGHFLAAGGQAGWASIWTVDSDRVDSLGPLNGGSGWIDQLAWNPICNQLAFNPSAKVQIWDAQQASILAELPLAGTAQALDWHPDGQQLAIACKSTAHVWQTQDGQAQDQQGVPACWDMRSAILKLAWSFGGNYLAVANLDQTVLLQEWQHRDRESPFIMQGFPGKIRQLLWSEPLPASGEPLLVVASGAAIAVWERHQTNWESRLLEGHNDIVQDLAFQPETSLLASASSDGQVCLWENADTMIQILGGIDGGFSCLAWHPQGQALATAGQQGEILVWIV